MGKRYAAFWEEKIQFEKKATYGLAGCLQQIRQANGADSTFDTIAEKHHLLDKYSKIAS